MLLSSYGILCGILGAGLSIETAQIIVAQARHRKCTHGSVVRVWRFSEENDKADDRNTGARQSKSDYSA